MELITDKIAMEDLASVCKIRYTPEQIIEMLHDKEAIAYCKEFIVGGPTLFGQDGDRIYRLEKELATEEYDNIDDLEKTFARKYREMDTEAYAAAEEQRTEDFLRIISETDLSVLEKYKLFIDYEIEKKKGNNPPSPFTMENLWDM